MSRATAPLAALVGTTLAAYCLWQLAFDPFRGPLPGRLVPLVALGSGVVGGVALAVWGLVRLDLLRRP